MHAEELDMARETVIYTMQGPIGMRTFTSLSKLVYYISNCLGRHKALKIEAALMESRWYDDGVYEFWETLADPEEGCDAL